MRVYVLIIVILFFNDKFLAQGTWQRITDYPGGGRGYPSTFNIGNSIYVGLGQSGAGNTSELYQYDFATGVWTKKSNLPAAGRWGASSTAIGSKGYVIGGVAIPYLKDLWEFDSNSGSWTKKANYPGAGNALGIAVNLNQLLFYGLAYDGQSGPGSKQLWSYDNIQDKWTQKADFPGNARGGVAGVAFMNKAFVGLGAPIYGGPGLFKDWWCYDPGTDSWTKLADFPGTAREAAVTFTSGSFIYVGLGKSSTINETDFYRYDFQTNTWTPESSFPLSLGSAAAVSGGGFGFVTLGYDTLPSDDIWRFSPPHLTWLNETDLLTQKISCQGKSRDHTITIKSAMPLEHAEVSLYSSEGKFIGKYEWRSGSSLTIHDSDIVPGLFFANVREGNSKSFVSAKFLVE